MPTPSIWPAGYNWAYPLTLPTITGDLISNFTAPLLGSMFPSGWSSKLLAAGNDIYIGDGAGARWYHELVSLSGDTAEIWAQIPSAASGGKAFVFVGCAGATDPGAAFHQATWSPFAAMWHLAETGTNPVAHDSTANANNSTTNLWTPVAGQIGGAASLNGTSQWIGIPGSAALVVGAGNATISAWINTASLTSVHHIISTRSLLTGGAGYQLDTYLGAVRFIISDGTNTSVLSTGALSTGGWHLIHGVIARPTAYLYVDGEKPATADLTGYGSIANTQPVGIGRMTDDTGNTYNWHGILDNVNVSMTVRNPAAEFASQSNPTWWTVGSAIARPSLYIPHLRRGDSLAKGR